MKTKLEVLMLLLAAAVAQASTLRSSAATENGQTNSLTALLQQGLFEEQANRNLDAAISYYQSLATQFDKDRSLAATAIFRLGECYRAQGRTNEAAAQYQRILREFPDQQTLATLSRQDLAGLGIAYHPQSQTRFQPIITEIPPDSAAASESSDAQLWNRVKDLPQDQLEKVLPTLVPDAVLTGLLQQRNDAEVKLAELHVDYSTNSIGYVREEALLKTIDRQIAERINGIMQALKLRAEVSQTPVSTSTPTDEEGQEIRRIQEMIQNSPDLINAPVNGSTPLVKAAYSGWLRVATYLLDHGADVNARCYQIPGVVRLLNRNDATPGVTPLLAAVTAGNRAMTELLLGRSADVNARDNTGYTPLHIAAKNGFQAVVETLLANKADVNAQSYGREAGTPLHVAALGGYSEILDKLLRAGAKPDNIVNGQTALSWAVAGKNLEAVKMLLANKANPNAGSCNTPLVRAAFEGDVAILEALLQAGAEPDQESAVTWVIKTRNGSSIDNEGKTLTPLCQAVYRNNAEAVRTLLKYKANPDGKDLSGQPLIFSVVDSPDMLKALLDAGANPNVENKEGRRPLSYAAERGSPEIVKSLLAAKADPNDSKFEAPLLVAVHQRDAASAELLLQAGANPNAKAMVNWSTTLGQTTYPSGAKVTPMFLAVTAKHLPLVQLLLKFKADPNDSQTDGQSPLFQVLDRPEIVKALLDAGASAEAMETITYYPRGTAETFHETLVQEAAYQNQAETLELLLQHGADPDVREERGNSALHYAAFALADEKVFTPLLDHGVSPNVRNNGGKTPLDIVKEALQGSWAGRFDNLSTKKAQAEKLIALLHQRGALDQLPNWDRITVSRPSENYSTTVFWKGTNDWNRFTLLETLLNFYSPPSHRDGHNYAILLPFPDLTRVTIVRSKPNTTNQTRIKVDLLNSTNGIDCARNVPLEFGDVLEIPEREHALGVPPVGLTASQNDAIVSFLKGSVRLAAGGKNVELPVYPDNTSLVGSVLARPEARGVLLSSSDLSRVKVTRRDPKTGRKCEWTLNCTGGNAPDLWLRDGDVIEVPQK